MEPTDKVSLTYEQLQALGAKMKEDIGKARVLTEADYNYPSNNPTGVALWLLPTGTYYNENGVSVWLSTANSIRSVDYFIVSKYSAKTNTLHIRGDNGQISMLHGASGSPSSAGIVTTSDIIDRLTFASPVYPLSANQGKVLKDLIDSIAIRGAGAPTTSTVGTVGQLYEDGTNGMLYQLKSIDITVTPNTYNWEEVGGGSSSYTAGDGIDITNDVISATNTGKARELTADDYNWPTSNPDGFAPWLFSPGLYAVDLDSTFKFYPSKTLSLNTTKCSFLTFSTGDLIRPTGVIYSAGQSSAPLFQTYTAGGDSTWENAASLITFVSNSLTSTSTTNALSAAQGKVLNDKIGGDLSSLTTTDKTSLIAAINELTARVAALEGN